MPLIALSRPDIRQRMVRNLLGRRDYLIEAPSTYGASSLTFDTIASRYPRDHWTGGEARLTVGSATETRRISASTAAGVLSLVKAFTSTPSGVAEIIRAPQTFDAFDEAIEQAGQELARDTYIDAVDPNLMLEPERYTYPLPPSTTFAAIHRLETQNYRLPFGEFTQLTPFGLTSASVQATTTRLAQAVKIPDVPRLAAVWLRLRKEGSPTGSPLVRLRASASDLPSTVVGSTAAININLIESDWRWVRFPFTATPALAYDTAYHLDLDCSGMTLSASSYVEWQGNSQAMYARGDASTSSNDGTTWSLVTSQARLFRLEDVRGDNGWVPIPRQGWEVHLDSTRRLNLFPNRWGRGIDMSHVPLRIAGQRIAVILDDDSDTSEVDGTFVENLARAIWLEQYGSTTALRLQAADRRRQMVEVRIQRLGARPRPGSRRVEAV